MTSFFRAHLMAVQQGAGIAPLARKEDFGVFGVKWRSVVLGQTATLKMKPSPPGTAARLSPPRRRRRTMDDRELEAVAAECHKQWAGWAEYMLGKTERLDDDFLTLEDVWAVRWYKQINTPYADLSESEKESDRREARKILAALKAVGHEVK